MTSAFFQISSKDFLQALRVYDNPSKDFALRIVSFQSGLENYIYLNDVTIAELGMLITILKLKLIPNLKTTEDLRKIIYGGHIGVNYYY